MENGGGREEASGSNGPSGIDPAMLNALIKRVEAEQLGQHHGMKESYAFWETQPVAQFNETGELEEGSIDAPKTVQDIRKDPYPLPADFEWCLCDVSDTKVNAEVYKLLSFNYVEDEDNMFRFNYSSEFLRWALQPPGYREDWHVGVRVATSKKLVAFISAIPAKIRVHENVINMVEINFLCVHKKLRSKRLAPVLIKEITRRVNLCNIWQAAYTAGVVIPKPVCRCRYWHRSLNPKKLIDVNFSRLAPRMTMARTIKLYQLPDTPLTPGVRPMEGHDVPQVTALLNKYLEKYKITQLFDDEDVAHWFRVQPNVVEAFVVEGEGGAITDLISFYALPSSILGHPRHQELKAAYLFYTVPGSTSIKALMQDALILAHSKGYDVFNALDLMENATVLKDLKFGVGDGRLQYYLYNWRVREELKPDELGLILL